MWFLILVALVALAFHSDPGGKIRSGGDGEERRK